jgi:GNAT superfamily N-acetyltransferase
MKLAGPKPDIGAITLRAAAAEDAEYIYRLTEGAMRGYVEATFGAWNESANRARVFEAATSGKVSLIYCAQALVGAIQVERGSKHIQLEQIYIDPAHQRRGIGTRLVQDLISEATRDGKPVRLRMLKVNPVLDFYSRLGFAVTEATDERYFMEYHA